MTQVLLSPAREEDVDQVAGDVAYRICSVHHGDVVQLLKRRPYTARLPRIWRDAKMVVNVRESCEASMSAVVAETLADVVQRLGNIDLSRIRMHPAPGTATADDVARIRDREKRLFELIDGVLVEKAMGFRQSLIALLLGRLLGNFVSPKNLGLVVGADGMLRLFPDTVRIPDVAFIAWNRLPGGKVPVDAVPSVAPTLAIEVLSDSNTAGEMARKRADYFAVGVELVWEVDIELRTVAVYSSPDRPTVLDERDTLTGDSVLSDFRLPLHDLFAELDRTQQ